MGALTKVCIGFLLCIIVFVNTGMQATTSIGSELYKAAKRGDLPEVKHLAGDNCDEVNWHGNSYRWTPLEAAAKNNYSDIVMFLVSCNADPNIRDIYGYTPLMTASRFASGNVVNALLMANPDLDHQTYQGWTALMLATRYSDLDAIHGLIKAGAQLDLMQKSNWTALMIASNHANLEVAKALIAAGANLDMQEKDGLTALMLAIGGMWINGRMRHPNVNMTTILLEAGADMDIQDHKGKTALHWAAEISDWVNTRSERVLALLQYGANTWIKSNDGHTAWDLAWKKGNMDILWMIEQYTIPGSGNTTGALQHKLPAVVMKCFVNVVEFLLISLIGR